jgi:hypothetical protein
MERSIPVLCCAMEQTEIIWHLYRHVPTSAARMERSIPVLCCAMGQRYSDICRHVPTSTARTERSIPVLCCAMEQRDILTSIDTYQRQHLGWNALSQYCVVRWNRERYSDIYRHVPTSATRTERSIPVLCCAMEQREILTSIGMYHFLHWLKIKCFAFVDYESK